MKVFPNATGLYAFRGWVPAALFLVLMWSRGQSDTPLNHWGLILVALGWSFRIVASLSHSGNSNSEILEGNVLVTTGPYGLSRNPMYVGNVFVAWGIVLFSYSLPWLYVLLLSGAVVIHYYFVILREEEYLEKLHGLKYLEYKNKVSRWWGLQAENNSWTPLSIVNLKKMASAQWANLFKSLFLIFLIIVLRYVPASL